MDTFYYSITTKTICACVHAWMRVCLLDLRSTANAGINFEIAYAGRLILLLQGHRLGNIYLIFLTQKEE
jgi:hypothetical protein